jgi:hypothetical protein
LVDRLCCCGKPKPVVERAQPVQLQLDTIVIVVSDVVLQTFSEFVRGVRSRLSLDRTASFADYKSSNGYRALPAVAFLGPCKDAYDNARVQRQARERLYGLA